ncbi:MAG: class II aldolase/adducin family protein [Verrucomicrobiota bacterium]
MKNVISLKEVEEMVRQGKDVANLPADVLLTPSARDYLRDLDSGVAKKPQVTAAAVPAKPAAAVASGDTYGSAATGLLHVPNMKYSSKTPKAELEAYFNSPEINLFKAQICDIGRRLWERGYVDGNGGNIAIKVGEDIAVCTPTLVSKGFMKTSDVCLVDFEGNQLAGTNKRTSEILMHLQMMKRQPRAVATVHCHPPHSTAFAVAQVEPPTCMIPEIEVMIGTVPVAEYQTPGTPEMGKLVADLVDKHNTVLMGNHGAVAWSHVNVEDAYFKMEILEAYCHTVVVAMQLGVPLKTFSPAHLKDLIRIKTTLGIPDSRVGLKECELCDNSEWRTGAVCDAPSKPAAGETGKLNPDAEKLVQAITEQILSKLK